MLVAGDCGFQVLAHPFGGGLRPEKIFSQVIVDANDSQAFGGEIEDGLRSNQPRRTGDQRNTQFLRRMILVVLS